MRALPLFALLAVSGLELHGQGAPATLAFDVASVRQSQHPVGPDYNNQVTYSPAGFNARNVTLKRLIAEAYRLQLNQISGPNWLDRNEYDVEARADEAAGRAQMIPMLRSLLADRFRLKVHSESREMRVYELTVSPAGLKIQPVRDVDAGPAHSGFHFHGDMQRFADLLSVQLSIPAASDPTQPMRASGPPVPVLDKTRLEGVYDFDVDIHPELDTDLFTLWQRALGDQFRLKLEKRKAPVEVLVVDSAERNPTEN